MIKWVTGIRVLAMLRRIANTLEGIHEQMIYRNERSFPPIYEGTAMPRKAVIHSGGKKHREMLNEEDD